MSANTRAPEREHLRTTLAEVAAAVSPFELRGSRWHMAPQSYPVDLYEVPSRIVVRVEHDDYPDWSWTAQPEMSDAWSHDEDGSVRFGEYGPIDADGDEHVAMIVLVYREYEDGHRDMEDALGGVDLIDSRETWSLDLDRDLELDELRVWFFRGDSGDQAAYLADTVRDMIGTDVFDATADIRGYTSEDEVHDPTSVRVGDMIDADGASRRVLSILRDGHEIVTGTVDVPPVGDVQEASDRLVADRLARGQW